MKQIKPEGKRQNFHVIPHFLIYNPEFGEKRILFQMALANNMMLKWNPEKPPILYNTNLLVRQMSFSQNYNSSGINEQVKKFMKLIEDKGYVKKVASPIKQLTLYNVPNENTEENLFLQKKHYGIIYNFEFLYLLRLHKTNSMPYNTRIWNVLLVLAYLRYNIIMRVSEDFNSKKNRKKRPETYVKTYDDIGKELGLHRTTIEKCVKVLDEAGIIYHEQLFKILPGTDRVVYSRIAFTNKYKYDGTQEYRLDSNYDYKKEIEEIKLQLKPYGEFGKATNASSDLENLD